MLNFAGIGACAAFEASCPRSITTVQQLAQTDDGWEPFARDPYGSAGTPPKEAVPLRADFSHIEIYDGPPKELADLVPDNERDTWTFDGAGAKSRPIFLACVYDGTYVRLVRRLPDAVTRCVAGKNGTVRCDEGRP